MWLPGSVEGLPSQGQRGGKILKIAYFLESNVGTNDWECRIRGTVRAVMYVALSKEEKHTPYGELVGTRVCITL
jgi:hypothetical protein